MRVPWPAARIITENGDGEVIAAPNGMRKWVAPASRLAVAAAARRGRRSARPLARGRRGRRAVVRFGLAAVERAFLAAGTAAEAEAVLRAAVLRAAGLRFVALRAAGLRVVLRFAAVAFLRPPPAFVAGESSLSLFAQLPDSTRCAASATASAIRLPSLDALVIIWVAAELALSAASRPASRILRRAPGLAAIAAAAAVRPAASISRLIAALAILSIVVSPPDPFCFRRHVLSWPWRSSNSPIARTDAQ